MIWYAHDHVWKTFFLTPLVTPRAPKSHSWGMTQATEWKSCLICFVSFICENTHKVWYKNLEIDFVIEIKWYLTIWLCHRAPGGGVKKMFDVARPIHVSNSHTKFDWISSNALGDSITDRQTDGGDYNIPFGFFKKIIDKQQHNDLLAPLGFSIIALYANLTLFLLK